MFKRPSLTSKLTKMVSHIVGQVVECRVLEVNEPHILLFPPPNDVAEQQVIVAEHQRAAERSHDCPQLLSSSREHFLRYARGHGPGKQKLGETVSCKSLFFNAKWDTQIYEISYCLQLLSSSREHFLGYARSHGPGKQKLWEAVSCKSLFYAKWDTQINEISYCPQLLSSSREHFLW